RRRDGRPPPPPVHGDDGGQLGPRDRPRGGRDAARPVLRAVRRPRGFGGPPRGLHRDRQDAVALTPEEPGKAEEEPHNGRFRSLPRPARAILIRVMTYSPASGEVHVV